MSWSATHERSAAADSYICEVLSEYATNSRDLASRDLARLRVTVPALRVVLACLAASMRDLEERAMEEYDGNVVLKADWTCKLMPPWKSRDHLLKLVYVGRRGLKT